MKTLTQFVFLFLALGLISSCKNAPSDAVKTGKAAAEAAAPAKAANFAVNTGTSVINWTGSKPTGSSHSGTIKLSGGQLAVADGDLKSGSFDIDMNSIANADLPVEKRPDLEGHLKHADFFEVEKFPAGKFVITGVNKASGKEGVTHVITGNLTLKGITKSISFDANVAVIGNNLTAVTPSFKINRTEWGVNFHSGVLGTVKDKLINDDIALTIDLKAAENVN